MTVMDGLRRNLRNLKRSRWRDDHVILNTITFIVLPPETSHFNG
jgi:hypothetical protein